VGFVVAGEVSASGERAEVRELMLHLVCVCNFRGLISVDEIRCDVLGMPYGINRCVLHTIVVMGQSEVQTSLMNAFRRRASSSEADGVAD
jgi:hypothetical protein